MSMRDDHTEENTFHGGTQKIWEFPNGYGASVICHQYSYGGDLGFWEVSVLGKDGALCYNTPVTDYVIGWLTEDEVNVVLSQIESL